MQYNGYRQALRPRACGGRQAEGEREEIADGEQKEERVRRGEGEMHEREREREQTPYSGLFCSPVTSRLQINPANWFVPQQGYQMTDGWRE